MDRIQITTLADEYADYALWHLEREHWVLTPDPRTTWIGEQIANLYNQLKKPQSLLARLGLTSPSRDAAGLTAQASLPFLCHQLQKRGIHCAPSIEGLERLLATIPLSTDEFSSSAPSRPLLAHIPDEIIGSLLLKIRWSLESLAGDLSDPKNGQLKSSIEAFVKQIQRISDGPMESREGDHARDLYQRIFDFVWDHQTTFNLSRIEGTPGLLGYSRWNHFDSHTNPKPQTSFAPLRTHFRHDFGSTLPRSQSDIVTGLFLEYLSEKDAPPLRTFERDQFRLGNQVRFRLDLAVETNGSGPELWNWTRPTVVEGTITVFVRPWGQEDSQAHARSFTLNLTDPRPQESQLFVLTRTHQEWAPKVHQELLRVIEDHFLLHPGMLPLDPCDFLLRSK